MKYFETLIEDQETTISVLYQEQMIRIYSSEPHVIQRLSKALGKPTQKYIKSKTYWSGASWDIDFFALEQIQSILVRDIFIDKKLKPIVKKEKKKVKAQKTKIVEEKKENKRLKKKVEKATESPKKKTKTKTEKAVEKSKGKRNVEKIVEKPKGKRNIE